MTAMAPRLILHIRAASRVRRLLGLDPIPIELASRDVFGEIYARNLWGDAETRSGAGSSLAGTADIRAALGQLLRKRTMRVLLDAPCGDFNWMCRADLASVRYIGADVVAELIASNRRSFERTDREFIVADVVHDALPAADLILCRHLLIHLSFRQGLAALANFRRTGAAYLLATTNPAVRENREIVRTGGFRPVNMERPPFALEAAVETLPDPQGPDDPTVLGLYRLNP
jgi:hypothetical protein